MVGCLWVFRVLCLWACLHSAWLSSAGHLGDGTNSFMTSVTPWCPLSQLTPPGTPLLPSSRFPGLMNLYQKKKCMTFLSVLFCVWGGGVIETSCRGDWLPTNLLFLVFLWPGFRGASRWLGQLDFNRAFHCPRTMVLYQSPCG